MIKIREIRHKYILSIFIVAIFFVAISPSTVSSAEQDSRLLEITIEDSDTASVEWRIPYPREALTYLQVAYQILQENIANVEEGNEQLFLQDVQNIRIAKDNETLIITFNLAGNYSGGFITGKYRDLYELGEYAPVGVDVFKVNIPDGKYFSSVNPGPNEIVGNELIYYDYNWIYPLEINYSDQLTTTQIGEEWKLPTIKTISVADVSAERGDEVGILAAPTPISNFSFGINEDSKYTIWGYGSYVGTDEVPGAGGKTAYEVASDYKPELYKETGGLYPPSLAPNSGYYRVLKGKDPYTGFDAYLIQYIMYWDYQACAISHKHDYEPIFIWVKNIGDRPYRVAYDRWKPLDWHIYDIHRTDLWSDSSGQYNLNDMDPVYTQDKSYYPIGRHLYTADLGNDLWLHDISTSLSDYWNGNHVKLNHANCFNTFDVEFPDPVGPLEPYPLIPLDDAQLKIWHRIFKDDPDLGLITVAPFTIDVSDSFYGVFWDGVSMPEQKITTILNSATPNGNTLTVDANLYYTLDPNGSPLSYPLKGLHGDRFNAWLGSTLLSQSSITETSAGRYQINYDISSFTPGQTYTFKLTVKDNLDLLDSTNIKSVTIPGDSQPPIISTPSDVPDPVCKIGTGSPDQLTISSTIYDTSTGNSDIVSATLHYNQPGSSWTSAAMAGSFGSPTVTATWSGAVSGAGTFYYYITAQDSASNIAANNNNDNYYTVTVNDCSSTPGDSQPPIISTPSESADPICKSGTGSPDQLTISATISDVSTGGSDVASATMYHKTPGSSSWAFGAMDGSFNSPTVTATWSGAVSGAGTFYYYITAQDSASNIATNNNNGNYYTVTVNDCSSTPGDSQPPIISTPSESADPICKSGTGSPDQLTISATISDVSTGGSDIASATMYHKTPGSSSWAFGAMDGSFNSPTVTATKSGPLSIPGIHKYYITAKDAADNLATSSEYTVTVNDCSSSSPGLIDNFQDESGITQILNI